MAGIGDYEEGKPFQLKSGNAPSFKNIGSSALKDLGHGGHPGLTEEEAAAATHGGKMSEEDIARRKKRMAIEKEKDIAAVKADVTHNVLTGKPDYGKNIRIKEKETRAEELIKRREARDKDAERRKKVTTKTKITTKDFPHGSEKRKKEYDRRGWKYDDTIKTE